MEAACVFPLIITPFTARWVTNIAISATAHANASDDIPPNTALGIPRAIPRTASRATPPATSGTARSNHEAWASAGGGRSNWSVAVLISAPYAFSSLNRTKEVIGLDAGLQLAGVVFKTVEQFQHVTRRSSVVAVSPTQAVL